MTPAARFRFARRLLAIALLVALCVPLHYLTLALWRRSGWPRRFLRWAARAAGARVRLEGVPADAAAVLLLPNHLSALDIPILAGATGCVFVAKGELETAPVVGWLAGLNDTVYVARADRLGVAEQVAKVRAALARGRPVTIFAEGRTGDGRTVLPFKPALLAAAEDAPAGLAVQPVLIDYGAATEAIAWPDGEPGMSYARRLLGRAGTLAVTVRLLDPFDPAALPGRKAVAAEARARVVGRWQAETAGRMGAP